MTKDQEESTEVGILSKSSLSAIVILVAAGTDVKGS
jgi:hypothetical protein